MYALPPGAPSNLADAFDHLASVRVPTVTDLTVMMLVEAAGKQMYDDLADGCADAGVRRLLQDSGRDEMVHAHRMAEVLQLLTRVPYLVPENSDNPYLAGRGKPDLSIPLLDHLIEAEANGQTLYETWAANCPNQEAAMLMRTSGREEMSHSLRLRQIREGMAGEMLTP